MKYECEESTEEGVSARNLHILNFVLTEINRNFRGLLQVGIRGVIANNRGVINISGLKKSFTKSK